MVNLLPTESRSVEVGEPLLCFRWGIHLDTHHRPIYIPMKPETAETFSRRANLYVLGPYSLSFLVSTKYLHLFNKIWFFLWSRSYLVQTGPTSRYTKQPNDDIPEEGR